MPYVSPRQLYQEDEDFASRIRRGADYRRQIANAVARQRAGEEQTAIERATAEELNRRRPEIERQYETERQRVIRETPFEQPAPAEGRMIRGVGEEPGLIEIRGTPMSEEARRALETRQGELARLEQARRQALGLKLPESLRERIAQYGGAEYQRAMSEYGQGLKALGYPPDEVERRVAAFRQQHYGETALPAAAQPATGEFALPGMRSTAAATVQDELAKARAERAKEIGAASEWKTLPAELALQEKGVALKTELEPKQSEAQHLSTAQRLEELQYASQPYTQEEISQRFAPWRDVFNSMPEVDQAELNAAVQSIIDQKIPRYQAERVLGDIEKRLGAFGQRGLARERIAAPLERQQATAAQRLDLMRQQDALIRQRQRELYEMRSQQLAPERQVPLFLYREEQARQAAQRLRDGIVSGQMTADTPLQLPDGRSVPPAQYMAELEQLAEMYRKRRIYAEQMLPPEKRIQPGVNEREVYLQGAADSQQLQDASAAQAWQEAMGQ